ncbi:MAG: HEAT repeat domain-containing protein [Spirochaetia bacterium]|jgi:HEAT repeat protein|nr:HEAT repeat domain-containing protein [Spirochaetia bacterium]
MDNFVNLILELPLWNIIGAGILLIAIIASSIIFAVIKKRTGKFIKYLEESLDNDNFSKEVYTPVFIKRHSTTIENFADKKNNIIITLSGLNKDWIKDLQKNPKEKTVKKILKYIPEQGLFACFLAALKKPKLTKLLLEYLGEEPGSLRKLPLSSSGEPFDGKAAILIFKNRMDEIREMAGDSEWPVRYFSIKLLLSEESDRSKRGIIEAFEDPHPLVRKSVIEECIIDDRVKIYELLKEHLLDDPSFEVRESAYIRINKEFTDIHRVDYSSLTPVQALHALEFLNQENEKDIDAALSFLEGEDLELRFPSAIFLQKTGILGNMLNKISFKDTVEMERTNKLLSNAAEVNTTGFLKENINSPAALFTALSILKYTGEKIYISKFAEKVFLKNEDIDESIWESAVECIKSRGNEAAINILLIELKKNRYNETRIKFMLQNLPAYAEHRIFKNLLILLLDNNFNTRNELINAIALLPADIVLPELFTILQGGRTSFSHKIRISALHILAKYKLPYCIQPIIEQLPTLPVNEAKEFSALLTEFAGETFDNRIIKLLKQPDGKVRAAVIASLPGTKNKEFVKLIKEALSDADPEVRIASIWALSDYEETKMLNQSFNMLRDSVERVRIAAAETLGKFASPDKLSNFSELLRDENEVDDVKKSAIIGLSKSDQNKAIDILVELIDENEFLKDDAVKALSITPSKKALTRIIENIKDASPVLRDKMMDIFKLMGESGEEALKKLLTEDISSLKDSITDILETTGYVEHVIRKLSHRDPHIRRSAADFLSILGTKSAFRGIVLAARDPDQDVRVKVTRALEKLASKSGEEILEALKNDPDKRVRKFTLWAMSRTKAKRIED